MSTNDSNSDIESVFVTLASVCAFVVLLVGGLLLVWSLLRRRRAQASQFTSRPTLAVAAAATTKPTAQDLV